MIVFKTFLKVLNKCKFIVLMYSVILILFGIFNMQTSDNSLSFTPTKPDVVIVNNDVNLGISADLVKYISDNSVIKENILDEESLDDALFYREVNYIIYIPEGFREDILNGKDPIIEVKSTGDYNASLASMLLNRYMSTLKMYVSYYEEDELIERINDTLRSEIEVEVTSKLDVNSLERATYYFNFTNYAFLAGSIYVICLILSSFKSKFISKRTVVSSMNYKKVNRLLFMSNLLFATVLWLLYVIVGFIILGDVMLSFYGVLYVINSFVFSMCSLSIAFLLGNLLRNKNAINGIVNVIALGSSFLCGAFVPMEWLPDFVLKIAHVLPSYYFIKGNEILKSIEVFSLDNLKPVFSNMIIQILFIILFVIVTNYVSKKRRVFN